jgi:hypothetical protein
VFGTDVALYRNANRSLTFDASSGYATFNIIGSGGASYIQANTGLGIYTAFAGSIILGTNSTTALTLDASQNATFAGNTAVGASKFLGWDSRAVMYSPADGIIRLSNNGATDFTRLQFGGVTSSFPSLSRSGVRLIARLADDSSVAEFEGALISAGAAVTVGANRISYGGTTATTVGAAGGASALPATPTGYIIVNVAGTQMKVPYYAN